MKADVPICVVGKVFKPNPQKVLTLNRCLSEFLAAVKFYINLGDLSRRHHKPSYEEAKARFRLPTALIQNARDKAGEVLKSFKANRREGSLLVLRGVSMRFDSRCYSFSKTTNVLTPYWLNLKLNHGGRVSLPILFGERQRHFVEDAFQGVLQFAGVEMVKRGGAWYAHLTVKKTVELDEKPEAVIGVDIGENNLATAIALTGKPRRGKFWRGSALKELRWKSSKVRANLQRKHRLNKVKRLRGKEHRQVKQELHRLANEVVEYVKGFNKPIIALENLTGLRRTVRFGRRMNRRVHAMPFRRLQTYIAYKALWQGIPVAYVAGKGTSKTCHRCGTVKKTLVGEVYRCSVCGMIYSRDLNAAINVAQRLAGQLSGRLGGDVNPLNQQMRAETESHA